ncbi:sigma-70 family RNA polymerase sigma factor [Streptomyces triticirhizae]|uniref:RNA polymerase sigma factor n=1 Tax=Streptomyces triticirhizae TaxID=2483353 RepID=A0A3M2LL11_9ACTN|nr:sigma-70 family RNA polymerase sigma factor [Streptomyces triticirhizae]
MPRRTPAGHDHTTPDPAAHHPSPHDHAAPDHAANDPATADEATVTRWALAARGGDRRAVESFFAAVRDDLLRYLTRLTGDPQGAEDLAQETLLRALRALPAFEGRSSARTWLLAIARRAAVDRVRYERSRPPLAATADWLTTVEREQRGHIPGFEERVALDELLARLPSDRARAFRLTQIAGMPYAEVAAASGCPVGTVRSRVARARRTLLAQLALAEGDPAPR